MSSEVVIYGSSLGNRGGTGVYLARLLDGLVTLNADGILVVTGSGVYRPSDVPRGGYPGGFRKVLSEQFRIPALLRSVDPALVHLPAFGGRPPQDIPSVVTLHDLAFMENPEWFPQVRVKYYRKHFASAARRSIIVMVDSEFTGREAVRLLGIPPERIRRIYLSTPDFTASSKPFLDAFPGAGEDYLIYTGTVEPRKNVEPLLDAWRDLRMRLPGYSLVVAGRWGWGSGSLRKRLRNEPRVIWTGALSTGLIRSAVSGARLLVYPSLYEGFGLPPLEAASAGVSSVIGPAAALSEVYGEVAAAQCGPSPGSIRDAILTALESPPDSDALRKFASRYTSSAMAGNVLEIYGEALE